MKDQYLLAKLGSYVCIQAAAETFFILSYSDEIAVNLNTQVEVGPSEFSSTTEVQWKADSSMKAMKRGL
jgi:hypothetical protein